MEIRNNPQPSFSIKPAFHGAIKISKPLFEANKAYLEPFKSNFPDGISRIVEDGKNGAKDVNFFFFSRYDRLWSPIRRTATDLFTTIKTPSIGEKHTIDFLKTLKIPYVYDLNVTTLNQFSDQFSKIDVSEILNNPMEVAEANNTIKRLIRGLNVPN